MDAVGLFSLTLSPAAGGNNGTTSSESPCSVYSSVVAEHCFHGGTFHETAPNGSDAVCSHVDVQSPVAPQTRILCIAMMTFLVLSALDPVPDSILLPLLMSVPQHRYHRQ